MRKLINSTSVINNFTEIDVLIRNESTLKNKIKIWEESYEKPHKNLFKTYYNWGPRKNLNRAIKEYSKYYDSEQIIKNEVYLQKNINKIASKVNSIIKFPKQVRVVYFVGLLMTNGFVDKNNGEYTTFMNLERYHDTFSLKIFTAHEITHNVHLHLNPIYYWNKNKSNWYQTLILEGVATFVTKKALNLSRADALWGNYLSKTKKQQFMKFVTKNKAKLKSQLLKEIDKTKREESPFFGGKRPKGCPYYRTGYYLGLILVEDLSKQMTLEEIMALKGVKLKNLINDFLTTK